MHRRNFIGAAALPLLLPASSACAQIAKGAKVFIGEPLTDPEKKPLAVFADEGMTRRLQQPLILGGDGDQQRDAFIAATNYSVRIRDSAGRQTLYLGEAAGSMMLDRLSLRPSAVLGGAGRNRAEPTAAPSVRDFGAKGDGMVDDTAAIQSALDSLDHNGSLYFPPTGMAFYKISKPLRLPSRSGLSLFGSSGRKATRIRLVGGTETTDMLRRADPSTAESNNINDTFIGGLAFEAEGASRHAINLTCMSRSVIRDCHFDSLRGAAIYVLASLSCVLTACRANGCGEFLRQDDTSWTGLNGWLVAGNYVGLCERWGIDIRVGMTGSAINGNVIESCKLGGIRLRQDCHGISVAGNYFEQNLTAATNSSDLYISETSFCRAIVVEGNYFNGSADASDYYYPIRMGYADGCRISNNFLNTGSKWIKFETPSNVANDIGQVTFHNGSFRPSSQAQPTLNFAGRPLKNFLAAKNRINIAGLDAGN